MAPDEREACLAPRCTLITPADLEAFTGTTRWYRHQPHLLLTDGARYAAQELRCYWLYDIIWSVLPAIRDQAQGYAVVELTKAGTDHEAVVTIRDATGEEDDARVIHRQAIPYTDFPWPTFTVFVGPGGDQEWVILLPSEY